MDGNVICVINGLENMNTFTDCQNSYVDRNNGR